MKKFLIFPSFLAFFLARSLKIKEVCIMIFLVSWINSGFGQGCNYSNPIPPIPGFCYSSGGDVRSVFLGSYCALAGSVNSPGTVIEDMNVYFGGNLIIDQGTTFRRCTLLFDIGKGIIYAPHWSAIFGSSLTSGAIFDNCFLGSCGNGKWKGISGAFNHFNGSLIKLENNSTISNAEIGLSINNDSGSFEFNGTTFENCDEGIRIFGSPINLKGPDLLKISNCIFNNANIGIRAYNYSSRFSLTSQNTFTDCGIAIWTDKIGSTTIRNQIINGWGDGIKITNSRVGSSPIVFLESNSINAINKAINILDNNVPGSCIINKNTLSGMNNARSSGINIEKSRLISGITIASSPSISGFTNGVRINKVSHNTFSMSGTNISFTNSPVSYLSNNISDLFRIITSTWSDNGTSNLHNIGSKGTVQRLIATNSPISFTNAIDPFFDTNNFDWSGSISGSNGILKLSSSSASSFCCNTFSGEGNNLYLLGTNINTKLRGSTFTNGKITFDNTMVGKNEHAGNRWKGNSTGKLIGSLPSDNEFIVNYAESNVNMGDIKPQNLEPSSIGPDWFKNDPNRNSNGCIPNCKIDDPMRPEDDIYLLPDTANVLGDCYPVGLDLDGDGVCDTTDPDPHDPCVPNFVDTDGDGICDSLDPDPLDACVPIFRDTDNDGICDTADPDPYDPCVPNGIDTDGDGICDIVDPDPVNPAQQDPISIYNCWWLTDINGDRLWSLGYHQLGLKYSISDLEWIAQHFTGTELGGYASLHYVEAMTFLYEVLHTSPYYRVVSHILNDKYIELCENYGSIPHFVKMAHDLKAIDKFSNQREYDYTKKQVYLNKLEFLASKLNGDNPVDSVHFLYVNEVMNEVITQMAGIIEVHESERENKLIQLTSDINNLPEDFPVYNALKDFYIIYDAHTLRGNPLTNTQIVTLTEMSKLCPLIFGEAVHHARAVLVGEEINEYSDFDDSCINTIWNTKKENSLAPDQIIISPNPSYDWLRLTSKYKLLKVDIQNTFGALLISKTLNDTDTYLNISNLPSAIYYIIVHTEDGNSVTKKIVKM